MTIPAADVVVVVVAVAVDGCFALHNKVPGPRMNEPREFVSRQRHI
jgi:hypothetical protein